MPQNFLACNRDQGLLLAPDLREWLPEDHLAWFVIWPSTARRSATFDIRPSAINARSLTTEDVHVSALVLPCWYRRAPDRLCKSVASGSPTMHHERA